jgi:GTP-binding protein
MLPIVAIVGRPNVGKSTLFNRLTRSRDAIVANVPGLTRDRHYGRGRVGDKPYLVVDTGGFEPVAKDGSILHEMARQARQAVDEADAILFVVDTRAGLTPQDRAVAEELRRSGRRVFLVVNKAEGMDQSTAGAEFHALGLGDPLPVSAEHGDHVPDLMDIVLAGMPAAREDAEEDRHPRIAIVGRPNVGKSTLVNALLGEERVVVFDQPGTTRDSIYIEFERDGRRYTLIDTAGLRRRGRVSDAPEKFSVMKALQAIEDANVAILVLDARQDISEQDAHVAGFILEAGRALVVAVNKWEKLPGDERDLVKRALMRKLEFLAFARLHFISALAGQGLVPLLKSVNEAYAAAMAKLPTPKLTRALERAVAQQPPPRHGANRPKLRYAHQGGVNPPRVVIHGNSVDQVPDSYRRYLERFFREAFKLQGTPLRVELRSGSNPYAKRTGRRR